MEQPKILDALKHLQELVDMSGAHCCKEALYVVRKFIEAAAQSQEHGNVPTTNGNAAALIREYTEERKGAFRNRSCRDGFTDDLIERLNALLK